MAAENKRGDQGWSRFRKQSAFVRFCLTGGVFTILGPGLFWLIYPLGPFLAVATAEIIVHTLRFLTFRKLVFPASDGYRVSLPRYLISVLPISITGVVCVALFRGRFDRTQMIMLVTPITVVAGYLWSRFVYRSTGFRRIHSRHHDRTARGRTQPPVG